mgnify:CR=1 FL=1
MTGTLNPSSTQQGAKGKTLVYFSSIPFDSYRQRPHFLAEEFLRGGFDSVVWVDPYPTRLPALSDFTGPRPPASAHVPCEGIQVVRPKALPIEPLPLSGKINGWLFWRDTLRTLEEHLRHSSHCVIGIGRPSRLAQLALSRLSHQSSFIDVLDNFPAFYRGLSSRAMGKRLRETLASVTRTYCSSTHLAKEIGQQRPDARVVLNGYSTELLPQPSLPSERRYIGYVGTIGRWFDWPLVISIAHALPEQTIRLIGPEFIPRPANLPKNVELLGERPHKEIAAFVREFQVGLIPFLIDELTEGVDPIKFYEYRSLGVPVWSTLFGEMRTRIREDGVRHIDLRSDWSKLWSEALDESVDDEQVAAFRAEISWSRRLASIVQDAG